MLLERKIWLFKLFQVFSSLHKQLPNPITETFISVEPSFLYFILIDGPILCMLKDVLFLFEIKNNQINIMYKYLKFNK
jgi:hypothetical protein